MRVHKRFCSLFLSCSEPSPTRDFLISLTNARFYWHISSASWHRHPKLWNVGCLFQPLLSPHIRSTIGSPGFVFQNRPITLRAQSVCLWLSVEASWLFCLLLREVHPAQMTQPLISRLPKRYRFLCHQQASCRQLAFFFFSLLQLLKDR